jgi:DNA repair protein RadC
MASAAAIIIAHSHPSGDPTPSEADIKITRDLIRAGQLLKIEVLDHIVNGVKKSRLRLSLT